MTPPAVEPSFVERDRVLYHDNDPTTTATCSAPTDSQLEVLLRLKQQSNAAFSFLSDEDPVHPYYVFLKSWGESALATEYARQQRLQAERAEARRKEEERRLEREEREAAAAKGPWRGGGWGCSLSLGLSRDGPFFVRVRSLMTLRLVIRFLCGRSFSRAKTL